MKDLKGVLIVDKFDSPLWRTATSHSLDRNLIVVAALSFNSPQALSKWLLVNKPDYIIFMWRMAFQPMVGNKRSRMRLLSFNPYLFLLCPDFIFAEKHNTKEQSIITMSDGIFVTCNKLYHSYKLIYDPQYIRVLHDMPDISAINLVNSEISFRKNNFVVWVGNSKWGKSLGFNDHKGLLKFAFPTLQHIKAVRPQLSYSIIDSSVKKLTNLDTLREIKKSSCLIFTSDSEGTGLPLLEAAALGTPIVTVDVGIASELLESLASSQICERNIQSFAKKVVDTLDQVSSISILMSKSWQQYLSRFQTEFDSLILPKNRTGTWRSSNKNFDLVSLILWKMRVNHVYFVKVKAKFSHILKIANF